MSWRNSVGIDPKTTIYRSNGSGIPKNIINENLKKKFKNFYSNYLFFLSQEEINLFQLMEVAF